MAKRNEETTTPRVWVACLACYNDGKLVGAWCDAVDADDLWADIAKVMGGPKHGTARELAFYGPHEEHAFHDHEGFACYRVSEYETVESVCAVGALIEEHGEAVALWLANDSTNLERIREDADAFAEDYQGEWDSLEEWADAQWEEMGGERSLDEWKAEAMCGSGLGSCVNFDAKQYAHECEMDGSIWSKTDSSYRVHVFSSP
jgi:antirestriction protein